MSNDLISKSIVGLNVTLDYDDVSVGLASEITEGIDKGKGRLGFLNRGECELNACDGRSLRLTGKFEALETKGSSDLNTLYDALKAAMPGITLNARSNVDVLRGNGEAVGATIS